MKIHVLTLAITIIVAIAAWPSPVAAQAYVPPAGPTENRYLDYYNAPTSPLGSPYHQYVLPGAQLQRNLNQLDSAVNNQDLRLQDVEQDAEQQHRRRNAPTGTHSTFQNYSHFFNDQSSQQLANQRRANRVGNGRVGVGVVGRRGTAGTGLAGRGGAVGFAGGGYQ